MSEKDRLFGKIKNFLLESKWREALMVLFPCFIFLILLIAFSRGFIILGGEGNYIINFELIRKVGSHSWVPHIHGIGFPSFSLNTLVVIYDFFPFLQKIGFSIKVINIISAWLVYVLPFLSMMWLLRLVLKQRFLPAYLISLFYVLNPFSTYHLQGLMFWNTAPFFVLPLVFGCLYKYYSDSSRLFFYFGILTAFLSFSFSNIPYLGVFHIFLVLSVIIIPFLHNSKWKLKRVLSTFFIAELSFILFNAWWFINLVRFQIQDLSLYYTKAFAISWVDEYSSDVDAIVEKLFSLTTLISSKHGNYFSDFYNDLLITIILFIPFIFITLNLLTRVGRRSSGGKKATLAISLAFLLVFFLNKGASAPFGNAYIWMMTHVPFFYIFKTPLEKFSVLSVFLLALALMLAFQNLKSKWLYRAFIIYLMTCSIPYFTLNFMPDHKFEAGNGDQSDKYVSRLFKFKKEYITAAESLNEDKLNYRLLSLPGSANYQTTILNHGNKYYRGMDPFIFSVNKPFITAYFDPEKGFFDPLFDNLSNNSIDELLNIYSVKKIVYNHDIYPSFGLFRENRTSVRPVEDFLLAKYEKTSFGSIDIFSRTEFLQKLYLPQSIILSTGSPDDLPEIVSDPDYHTRTLTYFSEGNDGLIHEQIRSLPNTLFDSQHPDSPIVEFKKINPTKYRIILHGVQGKFPLVFSERFHDGWKIYTRDSQSLANHAHGFADSNLIDGNQLRNYRLLDGNQEDQASKDELEEYVSKGWISTVGTGEEKAVKHWKGEDNIRSLDYRERYTVDFVSKNFYGTIQNENLPSGILPETWFKKPLDNTRSHAVANGYANSWIINTDEICGEQPHSSQKNATCLKNENGTYDLEVVLEFWPQRLYYLGLVISTVTLILSLIWMRFIHRKVR